MELKQKVETLLTEVDTTHRYSMSRIYGIYNETFGTNETAQSCASCLIRKVGELRKWLLNQSEETVLPKKRERKTKK